MESCGTIYQPQFLSLILFPLKKQEESGNTRWRPGHFKGKKMKKGKRERL